MARKVLMLNNSYEVLGLISRKRAIILVMNDKAEALEDSDDLMHSPSTVVIVPSVIRLKYHVKIKRRPRVLLNRKALAARDKNQCQYCFKPGETIDHVHPRSKGGKHEWTNVVWACKKCNSKKDNKTLDELGWKLPKEPKEPKNFNWGLAGLGDLEDGWKKYLSQAA